MASAAEAPAAKAVTARRAGAFFDVDGTLTRSDVFRDLVAFRRAVARPGHAAWMAAYPLRGIALLLVDRVDRSAVNRLTCAWHEGFRPEELARFGAEFQRRHGLARLHAGALELLRRHATLGHRIVFVTGSVDLFVRPLAELLAERLPAGPAGTPADIRVEAIRLEVAAGRFTGRVVGEPVAREEKARRVAVVAREEGLDLAASHAYGDSWADLALLEAVGRPAAVNPCRRLQRHARRRGWPVLTLLPPEREHR